MESRGFARIKKGCWLAFVICHHSRARRLPGWLCSGQTVDSKSPGKNPSIIKSLAIFSNVTRHIRTPKGGKTRRR